MQDFEILKNLLKKDRSCRRFDQKKTIGKETLEELVELTRYCASGRNLQPLKYKIICDEAMCSKIFPVLKWAGYLPEWPGPQEGERPVAYLIQCLDTAITKDPLCDDGLQLQAITLGYTAKGLAGCIIKAFNAAELSHILSLPDNLIPRYVVAIGYPIEKQVIIDMKEDEKDAFKYFRDENGTHYVPKRQLSELIIK